MKVLDFEKMVSILQFVKTNLPEKDGTLPPKLFTKENMDYLIEELSTHVIEIDI